MKIIRPILALIIIFTACRNKPEVRPGTYVDLNTGDTITVAVDPATGYAINTVNKQPVYLYVDDRKDTIFTDGTRVNDMMILNEDGTYEVDGAKVKVDDEELKIKYADYKQKYDGDDYKIKGEDVKVKVEGDGDVKIKDGDYKKKVDEDGDVKIKTENTKTKIEDGKTVTKERKKLF